VGKLKSEEAVIGSIMIDPGNADLVRRYVHSGKFFYDRELGKIYDIILKMHKEGGQLDLTTVVDNLPEEMTEDIPDLLSQIMDNLVTSAHAESYAKIVRNNHARRRLKGIVGGFDPLDVDKYATPLDAINYLSRNLREVELLTTDTKEESMEDLLSEALRNIEQMRDGRGSSNIITTGFHDLDRAIVGLERTEHMIIAARPAMGKTTMALNIALRVAKKGYKVLVFSIEMSKKRLVQRLISTEARVNSERMKQGGFSGDELNRIMGAIPKLESIPLVIYDEYKNISEIRSKVAQHHARGKVDLVVIDYLQLVTEPGKRFGSRQQELSYFAYEIVDMGKRYDTTMLTVSQLGRDVEKRVNKRPVLSDLYESGAIEASADKVLFPYRDEFYDQDTVDKGIAEIGIGKNRDGGTGTCRLAWFGEYFLFENLARE
jgi:replicative DNA helicase